VSILNCSGASRDVPEPQAVNIDPARTNAIRIPNAMPAVAIMAVPNMAVIRSSDDVSVVDVNAFVHVNTFVHMDAFVHMDLLFHLLSVCGRRDSEPKHGKDGNNDGNFP
jgi:hypothetical protein